MKNRSSIAEVAEKLLRKARRPLHYEEITNLLLSQITLVGKTPQQTVRSRLATNPRFKRVAEGVYALAEWSEYPAVRFAKDIGYDILRSQGKPMDLIKLGQEVLKERDFVGGPSQVARNVIRSDKRLFFDSSKNLVGLVEWKRRQS